MTHAEPAAGAAPPAEVVVALPGTLTSPQPPLELRCRAADVRQALLAAAAQAPHLQQRLFYKDRLLVGVTVNGRHVPAREAQTLPLADGDRVDVLPPVAGG